EPGRQGERLHQQGDRQELTDPAPRMSRCNPFAGCGRSLPMDLGRSAGDRPCRLQPGHSVRACWGPESHQLLTDGTTDLEHNECSLSLEIARRSAHWLA